MPTEGSSCCITVFFPAYLFPSSGLLASRQAESRTSSSWDRHNPSCQRWLTPAAELLVCTCTWETCTPACTVRPHAAARNPKCLNLMRQAHTSILPLLSYPYVVADCAMSRGPLHPKLPPSPKSAIFVLGISMAFHGDPGSCYLLLLPRGSYPSRQLAGYVLESQLLMRPWRSQTAPPFPRSTSSTRRSSLTAPTPYPACSILTSTPLPPLLARPPSPTRPRSTLTSSARPGQHRIATRRRRASRPRRISGAATLPHLLASA